MTTTTTELADLTACYWCPDPIDHQPGTAIVGLHWNRRPREIIEPAADDNIQPQQQRRFEWGFVTEYAYAHSRCAEHAAGARPGQLVDRYEYPWGDPDEAAHRDLVDAIVNGVALDDWGVGQLDSADDDDDPTIDELEAAADDEQYEPDLDSDDEAS